jgi:hypothetical protein
VPVGCGISHKGAKYTIKNIGVFPACFTNKLWHDALVSFY